jgi:hypothetical protein
VADEVTRIRSGEIGVGLAGHPNRCLHHVP